MNSTILERLLALPKAWLFYVVIFIFLIRSTSASLINRKALKNSFSFATLPEDSDGCTCNVGEWTGQCYRNPTNITDCNQIRAVQCTPTSYIACIASSNMQKQACPSSCTESDPIEPVCGNGICEYGENCVNCPRDCSNPNDYPLCSLTVNCKAGGYENRDLYGFPLSSKRFISFSFVDGPNESTTQLLDILKENGIIASFFLSGYKATKRPNDVKRILNEGHIIGSNGFSFLNLTAVLDWTFTDDLVVADKAFESVTNDATKSFIPKFMTPPYRIYNGRLIKIATDYNFITVLGNLNSNDTETIQKNGTDYFTSNILQSIKANTGFSSFIYQGTPDTDTQTLFAFKTLLQAIKSEDWDFVSFPQCLGLSATYENFYNSTKRDIPQVKEKPLFTVDAAQISYISSLDTSLELKIPDENKPVTE